MEQDELIEYWINSSDSDSQTMLHLLEKGDYTWALFVGHLVIEKLIKAWYVENVSNTPPFIHDLVRLADKAGFELSEDQKDILDTISTFNIRARYNDYKMEFHKKCSKEFTKKWVNNIKEFRKWMKKKLSR
jgi:HEPN domain-containing protein